MTDTELTFEKVKQFPNGEKVARRLVQLWKYAIDIEDSTPDQVMRIIERHEEKLFNRTQLDIVTNGSALRPFVKALKASTDGELISFINEHKIPNLDKESRARVFVDASGLVGENTGFYDWVLKTETGSLNKEKY